jgi:hypothetical protein
MHFDGFFLRQAMSEAVLDAFEDRSARQPASWIAS